MNREYLFVASEVRELEELLAAIPEKNVIERMSLEGRLKDVKKELEEMSPYEEAPTARLTFGGLPVFDGHGIKADFGAKATKAFADAFAAVVAGLSGKLSDTGPIPQGDENKLVITGTAIGSFGFELELPASTQPVPDKFEKTKEAMSKIGEFFRMTVQGSDDNLAEIIEEVHPRAGKKICEFLEILVGQHAWCGLEFGDRYFRYTDCAQVKKACARMREDNIHESMESFHGEFRGVLPGGRKFEFKLDNQNEMIQGKIDASIPNPDIVNRQWLYKPAKITLKVARVGQSRPRFTLMSLDDLSPVESSSQ